jgi:hypothetical protein
MLLTALLLAVHIRKIPLAYWIYTAYSLLIPLAALRIDSYSRDCVTLFPIFLMRALLTAASRVARWSLVAASAALQGYLAFYWAVGAKLVI